MLRQEYYKEKAPGHLASEAVGGRGYWASMPVAWALRCRPTILVPRMLRQED